MSYALSAAKLQTYHRCPRAYYYRYERRLEGSAFYGSAALGTSLHQALAQIYQDWHYQDPVPRLDWIEYCWNQQIGDLSPSQIAEGRAILRRYYYSFIASQSAMRKPLAVEGRIQGNLQVENLEFTLTGRYDRLDYCDDGLELIDYKSAKEIETIDPEEVDLQIGLYYLALEQRYQRHLKQMSLLYLRTGEKVVYEATTRHRNRVEQVISDLAIELRRDQQWIPFPGKQCQRCAYARYCPALQREPEPLPEAARPEPGLQLVLSLN
ncbi:MAG: PD-(D/E)XK nuclease family protein [Elainella sp. Prado103]|jgi:putative RecB family exonuclease|nr:PD-(D/E)XK nuclease family protein [Elainella sp. Prado103]